MLSGIKGSYVYTDATVTDARINTLIDGKIMMDGCPLFLYRGRVSDLTGTVTYTKMYCGSGTSNDGGIVNGNVTNYYTGTSSAIYLSSDGTSNGVAVVPETGYHEFIVATNHVSTRFNTDTGWRSTLPSKTGVYPIKRLNLATNNMFTYDNGIAYALIVLSTEDIANMKQCLAFEPIDLDIHEFR